jgi:UDP-2-acetamido-2-deoxy-ribo-hexuluronate aminotransferase
MQILESVKEIHFVDLEAQQELLRLMINECIKQVLDHGLYIFGPEVELLEKELAHFSGAKHVISCANGKDAFRWNNKCSSVVIIVIL